jgi:hypothetical protein
MGTNTGAPQQYGQPQVNALGGQQATGYKPQQDGGVWDTAQQPQFSNMRATFDPNSEAYKQQFYGNGSEAQIKQQQNNMNWAGGTPPWIFDESTGGPNPNYSQQNPTSDMLRLPPIQQPAPKTQSAEAPPLTGGMESSPQPESINPVTPPPNSAGVDGGKYSGMGQPAVQTTAEPPPRLPPVAAQPAKQQALSNELRGRPEGAPSYMKYGRQPFKNRSDRGRRSGSPNIFGGANRKPVAAQEGWNPNDSQPPAQDMGPTQTSGSGQAQYSPEAIAAREAAMNPTQPVPPDPNDNSEAAIRARIALRYPQPHVKAL